jgi:hypothetical protein
MGKWPLPAHRASAPQLRALAATAFTAASLFALVLVAPVSATSTFGVPTAKAEYGQPIRFSQSITTTAPLKRAELLVDFPGAAGPETIEVPGAPTSAGSATLDYSLETTGILPNTTLHARWRLTSRDGEVETGPSVAVRYDDTRFDWKTRSGSVVRVHWYQGSDAFGARALDIGEKAIRDTSQLLGVTETEPVDFFVYADQQAFYEALGPGTHENVGGQANAEIRTLFALIAPGAIDDPWVGVVIPHELTHLVFDTAVRNPYHFPPRWLNEGLAVYLSQGYDASDRASVESAARDGTLMPLTALTGDFPSSRDRFFLSYAESVSSVDYFVRTYGRDHLVALIRSYARGVSDDEAFRSAIGTDVPGFDGAWRHDLAAKDPKAYGPQPAPGGPLPDGWTQPGGSAGVPLPSANVPAGTGAASSRPSSGVAADEKARASTLPIIIAALGMLVAIAVIGYALARPRRRPPQAISPVLRAPDPPADNPPG